LELVGNPEIPGRFLPFPPPWHAPKPKPSARIPFLRKLTIGEMEAIARLRGWHCFAGMELLSQRGLLWQGVAFDDGKEWPAWVITDSTRRNAQARRIDGGLWTGIGSKKAKTLLCRRGSSEKDRVG
jgi:hypothetical protein